ncbi:uncharacterized protein LOC120780587 isoform X1 [Bactrocera tryoni]|uniref:uncharacterized protein LOC120780587 isoform X1 n=1 Tax=Bactrocera tryoni TaxID=59916 RepID=UPI001A95FE36|nr:uncharacterized protein LOC120780587 isoform X1 [Bactrocera tryoni]
MEDEMNLEIETPKNKRVRKIKVKWTAEETERLIQEVESREGTWNFLSHDYRDRNLREAQWHEVADILNMPRSEVAAKWNSLRCSFRAAFKRKTHTKSGQGAGRTPTMNPLYNSLKFLEPTLRVETNTTTNLINGDVELKKMMSIFKWWNVHWRPSHQLPKVTLGMIWEILGYPMAESWPKNLHNWPKNLSGIYVS